MATSYYRKIWRNWALRDKEIKASRSFSYAAKNEVAKEIEDSRGQKYNIMLDGSRRLKRG